jgi:two-component system nitrate/nitrite response regulator NarL
MTLRQIEANSCLEVVCLQTASRNSLDSSGSKSGAILWSPSGSSPAPRNVNTAPEAIPDFRVLIVDRDSMSGDLLADALVRDRKWQAVAVEPKRLLLVLGAKGADLVIIGSDLGGQLVGCFELVQMVTRNHPAVSVVVLLNETSRDATIQSFRCGARGVFSRQQPMVEFFDCIEHVRRGSIWVGRHETDFLLEAFKSLPAPAMHAPANSPGLSTRELQVVTCAAEGKTNRAIAAELGLSEHTVKNYLFKAFDKLRVSNRVELLFYLTTQGHIFKATEAFENRRRTKAQLPG